VHLAVVTEPRPLSRSFGYVITANSAKAVGPLWWARSNSFSETLQA
jgi:hypothetical protein